MYAIKIHKIDTKIIKERNYRKISDDPKAEDDGYGYVDEEKEKEVETLMFEQKVEELDLNSVIKAINNI